MGQDMVGCQFGRLTVIEWAERKPNGKKYWRCRCSCGKETVVEEFRLKSGHTRSCGCYRRDRLREKALNITGQRYGRLVVLGQAFREDGTPCGWTCRCDCGNMCVCQKGNLRSGVTKSCGCLQGEQRKTNMKNAIHFVEGTCVERIASSRTFSSNTTGHRGVYRRANGRWRASIGFQGKVYNLGTYEKYDDAVRARLEAEERFYRPFLEKYRKNQKLRDDGR